MIYNDINLRIEIEKLEHENELLREELKRTCVDRFIEKTICRAFGHHRLLSVFKGKYNPRRCCRCGQNVALWAGQKRNENN